MPESRNPSLEAVTSAYDNTAAIQMFSGENIHVGYWPDGQTNSSVDDFAQAQDRLTDLVGAQSGARAGLRMLDVGCGIGASARRLAGKAGVSVIGVTISPQEVEVATARSRQQGLDGQVSFQLADAASLPFADEEFDAAIAIESIQNMPDKPQAFREIIRILRPGATLAIADLTLTRPQTIENSVGSTEATASILSLMAPPTLEEYRQLAARAGFEVQDVIDLSQHARASFTLWRKRAQARRTDLKAAASVGLATAIEQVFGLLEAAATAGQVGYTLLAVRKPRLSRIEGRHPEPAG